MKPMKAKFEAKVKVDKSTGCWIWTGATKNKTTQKGHCGVMYDSDRQQVVDSHKISWSLFIGTLVPEDKKVTQKCGNPMCVNPACLVLADRQVGGKHPGARLTEQSVRNLRMAKHRNMRRITIRELGVLYNVSHETIRKIILGRVTGHESVGKEAAKTIIQLYQPREKYQALLTEKVSRAAINSAITGKTWASIV